MRNDIHFTSAEEGKPVYDITFDVLQVLDKHMRNKASPHEVFSGIKTSLLHILALSSDARGNLHNFIESLQELEEDPRFDQAIEEIRNQFFNKEKS